MGILNMFYLCHLEKKLKHNCLICYNHDGDHPLLKKRKKNEKHAVSTFVSLKKSSFKIANKNMSV